MTQTVARKQRSTDFNTGGLLQRQTGDAAKKPVCGPAVTDWLVDTIAKAKANPETVQAKQSLARAQWAGQKIGINAQGVVEGGLAALVSRAGKKIHKSPTELGQAQLDAADKGNNVWKTVRTSLALNPIDETYLMLMLTALAAAGKWWFDKETTYGEWDFKDQPATMQSPQTKGCPDGCNPKSATLCGVCHENDIPGNIFYGHLGAYLGFSETAILLGSNYANLQPLGGNNWDPPEDIENVKHGFHLPNQVTPDSLCKGLPSPVETELGYGCEPCLEKFQ